MKIKKPMLAGDAPEDLDTLKYPVYVSPKLDGIRAVMVDGKLLSRTFKPIPNHFIRETLEDILPDGVDGEIIIGENFQECTSGVMSPDGEPDFKYNAFDLCLDLPFEQRWKTLNGFGVLPDSPYVRIVRHDLVYSKQEVLTWERTWTEGTPGAPGTGFEGVMIRDPQGPYKFGRSTTREGYLLKLKRFEDAEAEIIGFAELMINNNEKETNELGRTKRSKKKAGLLPSGRMGALIVKDCVSGIEFELGTGFNAVDRTDIWQEQGNYLGKIVKYKYQKCGVKTKPRIPVFLGIRDDIDR